MQVPGLLEWLEWLDAFAETTLRLPRQMLGARVISLDSFFLKKATPEGVYKENAKIWGRKNRQMFSVIRTGLAWEILRSAV